MLQARRQIVKRLMPPYRLWNPVANRNNTALFGLNCNPSMRRTNTHLVIFIAIGFLIMTVSCHKEEPLSTKRLNVPEISLRRRAITSPMPDFPEQSKIRNVSGVAVVQLEIDPQGKVIAATVLESPDPLIAQSVAAAARQWSFKPLSSANGTGTVRGKLTFYYVTDTNGSRVENPREIS